MAVPPEQLQRGSVCLARDHAGSDRSSELVVLLQDVRRHGRDSVMVARLHSVTEQTRSRTGFYDRLAVGRHPAALLIPSQRVQGASSELYVSLLTIAPVPTEDILDRRGALTEEEMRQVSERLVKTLELDVSRIIRPGAVGRDSTRAQLPWWSRRGDSGSRPAVLESSQADVAEGPPQPPRLFRMGGSGDAQGRRPRRP